MLSLFGIFLLLFSASSIQGSQNSHPHCQHGRTAITHLFEWKWTDIAAECERFLGPYGYCGVQISPPNENRIVTSPDRPWWERYQPVSYKLVTRSGDQRQMQDMIDRCHKVGVNIYADIVINHMTGVGGTGRGTGGDTFDANKLNFPAVPYGSSDFNGHDRCPTGSMNIENYNDVNQVRNCRLVGLSDLALGKNYVRGKVEEYLNHLINMGVAGFRVDAAKHMWPGDLTIIFGKLHNLKSSLFGSNKRPMIYQEVIDMGGNEPINAFQYIGLGRVTNFMYGKYMGEAFRGKFPLSHLKNFGEAWGHMLKSGDSLNFIDNHDNQRGHGGGGEPLTHFDPRPYKMATAFMLAHPYGFPRIMSSFAWNRHFVNGEDVNNWMGPPHNSDMSTKRVTLHSDMTCGNGWVCEHRWRQIYNMVAFRNMASGTGINNWWDNGNKQIAFSRGNKAFLAMNLDSGDINTRLRTGLSSGQYCDVITGNLKNDRCTGTTVSVDGSGHAHIHVSHSAQDPMLAIHVGAKIHSNPSIIG